MNTNRITRFLTLLLAVTAAPLFGQIISPPQTDAPLKRWYVSGRLGLEQRGTAAENSQTFTTWHDGTDYNFQFGYRILPEFRAEIEYSSFYNTANTLASAGGIPEAPAQGHAQLVAWMFNLFYDYHITDTRFTIYAGAGAGPFKSKLRDLSNAQTRAVPPAFGGPFIFSGDSTGWQAAYQGQIGVSYAVSPSIDVLFGYRYFQGNPLHFVFTNLGGFTAGPKKSAVNALETGMRFNF